MSDGMRVQERILASNAYPPGLIGNPISPVLIQGLTVVVCTYLRPNSLNRFLQSLTTQENKPHQLMIVDASPDDRTEQMLEADQSTKELADRFLYFHVAGSLQGLTRQRNFALRRITTDLVAFFDDDIVLLPHCLREMEKAHRESAGQIVGVGAYIQNQSISKAQSLLWHARLLLCMMPDLQPGRYYRSGISTPWIFLAPTDEQVDGDWLPGCATMWKTDAIREVGFHEGFEGYALGEDLDFSLRIRQKGKLVVVGSAHVLHLQEPEGRPSHYDFGYMAIYNKYQIHRRALRDRRWYDVLWFGYTWTLDTLLLLRHLFSTQKRSANLRRIAGRMKAGYDILRGR
jgi:GT2 family glycosyltransferase